MIITGLKNEEMNSRDTEIRFYVSENFILSVFNNPTHQISASSPKDTNQPSVKILDTPPFQKFNLKPICHLAARMLIFIMEIWMGVIYWTDPDELKSI